MLIRALQAAAGNFGVAGYTIEDSLRFNDNDSAYLSRTPSVAGNRKTWTWSGWVKRGNVGISAYLLDADIDGSAATLIRFVDNDKLRLYTYDGSSSQYFDTTALFRDVSGWYHIVGVHDTTQSGADKLKLYVNGIRQAGSTTGSVADNSDGYVNSTIQHNLGRFIYVDGEYLDGYMAEVNFIDGQALTADSFGQIDATTGEWSPKAYEGTYGTNGFYLEFKDGAALGDDTSGNTNDWTPTNLASTDQMLDTPTNNFSTFNTDTINTTATLSEGNLRTDSSGVGGVYGAYGNIQVSSGKWYMEYALHTLSGSGQAGQLALIPATSTNRNDSRGPYFGKNSYWSLRANSNVSLNHYNSVVGDVMGIAYDLDNGYIWVSKNGTWNNADPSTGLSPDGLMNTGVTYVPFAEPYQDTSGNTFEGTANFGQDSSFAGLKTRQNNPDANGIGDFYYTPPDGFLALCENNLPTSGVRASGGTETTILDGGRYYKVHTFTSSDTFTVSSGGEVEYLVIAGGGGGSGGYGNGNGIGGAGAGGYRSSVLGESSGGGASAEPKLAVSSGAYTVTVGAGGAGGAGTITTNASNVGSNGSNSVFSSITAIGGGFGGSNYAGNITGGSGGSGGGGASSNAGGSGTTNQGYAGGQGIGSNPFRGGGGGGASAVGATGSSSGNGGNGVASSITGSSVTRAGGGGGGVYFNLVGPGSGGTGGGGAGGAGTNSTATAGSGVAGTVNTGSGGGGGGSAGSSGGLGGNGGAGGSGIVIIRYTI